MSLRVGGIAKIARANKEFQGLNSRIERIRASIERLKAYQQIAFHINLVGWEMFYAAKRGFMATLLPFSEIEAKTAELATVLSDLNGAIKNPAVEITKRATEFIESDITGRN